MSGMDLRGRLTLSIYPEAAELYGLGRDATYAAIKSGEIPSIRVGSRIIRVPTHLALRQLGWPDDSIARALGVELDEAPDDTEAGSSREPATATVHQLPTATREEGQRHGTPSPAG